MTVTVTMMMMAFVCVGMSTLVMAQGTVSTPKVPGVSAKDPLVIVGLPRPQLTNVTVRFVFACVMCEEAVDEMMGCHGLMTVLRRVPLLSIVWYDWCGCVAALSNAATAVGSALLSTGYVCVEFDVSTPY